HRKYGSTAEESAAVRETIRGRGAELDFVFNYAPGQRIYNTFDAHRLLHWAGEQGKERALTHALFRAYFTDGKSPAAHAALVQAAQEVGLDAERARAVLASDAFADEVRARERFYKKLGIQAVPSIIVNDRHLIQGGQPPEVFERVLRRLIGEFAATAS